MAPDTDLAGPAAVSPAVSPAPVDTGTSTGTTGPLAEPVRSDPPPRGRYVADGEWYGVLTPLMSQPNEWFQVGEWDNPNTGANTVSNMNRGKIRIPDQSGGFWEFTSRSDPPNNKSFMWAKFVVHGLGESGMTDPDQKVPTRTSNPDSLVSPQPAPELKTPEEYQPPVEPLAPVGAAPVSPAAAPATSGTAAPDVVVGAAAGVEAPVTPAPPPVSLDPGPAVTAASVEPDGTPDGVETDDSDEIPF